MFKLRKGYQGRMVYRSWCLNCECEAVREAAQVVLKEAYDNDDASIDICPGCGFYFSRFTTGISKGILRDRCKPCLKIAKLQKSQVFQEAKKLLLEYASDQYAVQNFLQKYSIKE